MGFLSFCIRVSAQGSDAELINHEMQVEINNGKLRKDYSKVKFYFDEIVKKGNEIIVMSKAPVASN